MYKWPHGYKQDMNKNVYLLYPAGYSGSFVGWCFQYLSNPDESVESFNKSNSVTYGGIGTAHLHRRTATHQGIDPLITWLMRNRPTEPQVYLINTDFGGEVDVSRLMQFDDTGIFIKIHHNNDYLAEAYGVINSVTKWPTCFTTVTRQGYHGKELLSECGLLGVDAFDASPNNLALRNALVKNPRLLGMGNPFEYSLLEKMNESSRSWYEVRHRLQPHEVTAEEYPLTDQTQDWRNRVFDISLVDIVDQKFIDFLMNVVQVTNVVNIPGSELQQSLAQKHAEYVGLQKNLEWFSAIKQWQDTGHVSEYLLSHPAIQSQVLSILFMHSGVHFIDFFVRKQWQYPGKNYIPLLAKLKHITPEQAASITDMNLPEFTLAPDGIKEIQDLAVSGTWKQMSLKEITGLYKTALDCRVNTLIKN